MPMRMALCEAGYGWPFIHSPCVYSCSACVILRFHFDSPSFVSLRYICSYGTANSGFYFLPSVSPGGQFSAILLPFSCAPLATVT